MIQKMIQISLLFFLVTLTACLKTRSDVSEQDQAAVYGKKNVENQMEAQTAGVAPVAVDEKDELIRNLNGRVEVLENQLSTIAKEKETTAVQDSQKIVLLQEALAKIEMQVQKFENDQTVNMPDKNLKDITDSDSIKPEVSRQVVNKKTDKKLDTYETAQQYFSKQEWKKAILNFQKYTDESPRGKNVADAKYKIGVSFQELGMKEEAMAFYEEVVANYFNTTAGKKSKTRLGSLKK